MKKQLVFASRLAMKALLVSVALLSTGAMATLYTTDVPFISQRNGDAGTQESACAPTSIAMIVKYYFPNSALDLKDVYHSGTQNYVYSGPLALYANVSNMPSSTLIDNWPKPSPECSFYNTYSNNCSDAAIFTGSTNAAVNNYLTNTWGFTVQAANDAASVYAQLRAGRPLIGHVYALGNRSYGHYLVIRGYDDNNTPQNLSDDTIYVNDPYDTGWSRLTSGRNRAISYNDFFVATQTGTPWFRDAYALIAPSNVADRANTVVVDIAHSIHGGGNNASHSFSVTDPTAWRYFYDGKGNDWAYTTSDNQAARWTPQLAAGGLYDVYVKYMADATSGNVTYTLHNSNGAALQTLTISQTAQSTAWKSTRIAQGVALSPGAYLRATNISRNTNIDTIQFVYRGEAASGPVAGSPDQIALMSATHSAGWAYFQEPSASARWLIASANGATYILSGANGIGGEMAWGEVAGLSLVSTINFSQNTVTVSNNALTLTTNPYRGVTLNNQRYISIASTLARDIAASISGRSMIASWYFFRVDANSTWYIVTATGSQPVVFRLRLRADLTDYDWASVDMTGWRVAFSPSSTGSGIRFSKP
jgi:Peptidase_C39 like family